MEKFDPLQNVQTSKVFFELLNNVKTSTEIAKKFGISPQSVYEHINRLINIRVVCQGKRSGKFQEYEIDYLYLSELFLQRSTRTLDIRMKLKNSGLTKNSVFVSFIENYLKKIGQLPLNLTLLQAMQTVEETLVRLYLDLIDESSLTNDEEIAFLRALKLWYEDAKENYTPTQAALIATFDEMNLTKKKHFSYM